jgi:2,4-dienoyl-CoA reductase-like NADH-dependent reductase (Old Yellow Enzyme family)
MTENPRRLFEPLRLGPIELRNRTVRAAAFEGMSAGHRPTKELVGYHRAVAAGGIGMTTVAYAAVERSGLTFGHQLLLEEGIIPDLARLTAAVHAEGARVSIQIGHAGNMANRAVTGERAQAPSARPNLYGPTWPRAMSTADMARVVESFARATRVALAAGFDAVEIHAGHGYLISQFLSQLTNRRRDAHGGSLDARMRFMREVVAAVLRAADGKLAVLAKMNLTDGVPGGQTIDDATVIAKTLESDGVHALVLSGGFVSRAPMHILRGRMPIGVMAKHAGSKLLAPFIRLAGPVLVPEVPYEDTYFLADAEVVRRAVRIPLVYVGGVTSRATASRVLAAGFDGIAMARALIREPDFIRRLQAEEDAASPCDHCNYCAARIYGTHMACYQVDPPAAADLRFIRPARSR